MATLEKIRSKGVLLVTIVALALFAFIIGDFLTQGSSFFNQSKETVADINGTKVNIRDYQDMIDQVVIVQKIESGINEVDERTMDQIRSYVWESMINQQLLEIEAAKMGLAVTKEELSDRIIGNNVHPLVAQRKVFFDQTGRFNKAILVQFLSQIDNAPADAAQNQQFEELKKYWLFWEKTIKFSILQEKYNLLIGKAVVPNTVDAEYQFNARNEIYDFNYVVKPYFMISDSAVSVSDNEIKDLYNKKLEQFKQEPNIDLKFITIDIKAQDKDYKDAEAWINGLSDEFKSGADVTALVNANSDIPYTGENYSEKTVPYELKSFAFSGNSGDVMGPVFANEAYTMAKIMETGILTSDSVKIRHIYITKDKAAKVDSIVNAVKSGASFAGLAAQYSAVKQTAQNGGEIGWITENIQGLGEDIVKKAFAAGLNQVFTVDDSQGTQIMQVTEKTKAVRKVKLAILERKVFPSTESVGKLFNQAKNFATELKADSFDTRAENRHYIVRRADNMLTSTGQIQNIEQSRQIIRWAFENKLNAVSDVFECKDKFVVAVIDGVNDKEYRSINKVQSQLKAELIRDKKAEILIAKMAKDGNTLGAIAAAEGVDVKDALGVQFSAYQFGAAGFEPAVLGAAINTPLNKLSAPVKGRSGVYVVQKISETKGTETFNARNEKMSLMSRYSYSLPMSIAKDMKDNADISDNRINFY